MESINTGVIRNIFYKGNTNNPDWENFHDIDYIIIQVVGKREFSKLNVAEKNYASSRIRTRLYQIMDQELTNQGRFLAAVKRPRENVVYGFTRERDKVLNYVARRALRDKNIANHTKEIVQIANNLMKHIGCDIIDSMSIKEEQKQLMIDYNG